MSGGFKINPFNKTIKRYKKFNEKLSERGVKEAEEAGVTLLSYKFTPEICATSFLQRSKSTAEIIFKQNERRN